MKRLIAAASLVVIILVILLFPRKVEHAVVVNCESHRITLYINGKLKQLKSNESFDKFTVIDFTYNIFKAYSFEVVKPIKDRVMQKGDNSYDLEKEGLIDLSKKSFYYSVTKSSQIAPTERKSLLVGKYNVNSYKDKNGNLKTFLIFPTDYSSMRIGLSTTNFASTYHDKLSILCSSDVSIYGIRDSFSFEIPKGTLISLEQISGKVKISTDKLSKLTGERIYIKGQDMIIKDILRGSPVFNPAYNGILEIKLQSKGLSVINETDMEDYLYKVVPSEMPASSALEALKCQAIAARTYAISDMLEDRFGSSGYYVDDSTMSQVYNNMKPYPSTNSAIDLTKGVIMTYKGKPIDAKYYSASSGTGANYEDVWFNKDGVSEDRPYIKFSSYLLGNIPVPKTEEKWLEFYKNTDISSIDSNSPYFRWRIDISSYALTKSLNKSLITIYDKRRDFISITKNGKTLKELPELENLKDIKILQRGVGGNVKEICFVFENATVTVKADINIRGSIKTSKEYTNEAVAVIRYKDKPIYNSTSLPSAFFSIEKKNDIFTIYGGGFGHGAGMSQYGAMALGKQGLAYREILDTYYKNITIEKVY